MRARAHGPGARTGTLAALAALAALLPLPPSAPAGATGGPPGAPAHVVELVGPSEVQLSWSPSPPSAAPVTAYDVAPLAGGVACPTCRGALLVGAGTTSVVLGAPTTAFSYAVRAVGAAGTSSWTAAVLPGEALRPATTPLAGGAGGGLAATPLDGGSTSPLYVPPPGFSRTVIRDGGFSALTASEGDLWVFGDTTVVDTPSGGAPTDAASCLTPNGTAAIAPPSLPLRFSEALQPAAAAAAAGTAECSSPAADLPAGATEPYQLLGSYPGWAPGIRCSNWVSGLADQTDGAGQPTDDVLASYGANCFDQQDQLVGLGGSWASSYQLTSPGAQVITLPLGAASSPDLPTASCPAHDVTTYDGGSSEMTGNYGSVVAVGGFDYFFAPYGNSTDAFAGLGIPESTCSSMGLARVPVGTDAAGTPYAAVPADYQYLLPGDRWESPATSGQPAAQLAAASADIMPADYGGAYAGQVDVAALAGGELAMVYLLPAPQLAPGGGVDVAAVRTADSPAGPWSAPVLFEMPWAGWGNDYQLVVHPELSDATTLTLSYVAVSDPSTLVDRQVQFMTLPVSALPSPGAQPPTSYRMAASDGGIFAFGDAAFYGSMGGRTLNAPIVGMAATPDGGGYFEVAADGGIFAFGDATFYGSMGGRTLNAPIVGMAATPDGGGYFEVAADGGIFAFGDATFYGSMGGRTLNAPIVAVAADPAGGYWEVAADGGIFAFGAPYYGSMGGHQLDRPIVGIAATTSGSGYWEVASDGGLFAFDAPYFGSMGGQHLDRPVVGLAASPTGGYWEVASDGGLFGFGAAGFAGSLGGQALDGPVVAITTG